MSYITWMMYIYVRKVLCSLYILPSVYPYISNQNQSNTPVLVDQNLKKIQG